MASFTIKQLDERVLGRLRAQAKRQGVSLTAYVKGLLACAAGLRPGQEVHDDLSELAGIWSGDEAKDFEEHVRAFSKIDAELWT